MVALLIALTEHNYHDASITTYLLITQLNVYHSILMVVVCVRDGAEDGH